MDDGAMVLFGNKPLYFSVEGGSLLACTSLHSR